MNNFQDKANFIWQVADDILRGAFKRHEYGDVILPFVVLRRLDCVLQDKKDAVIETHKKLKKELRDDLLKPVLLDAAGGLKFYNVSKFDLHRLSQDASNIEINFNNYINGYSENVTEILENFQIDKIVTKLSKNNLLFLLIDKFTEIDLHPSKVPNHEMGCIFEELLRRFSEISNETAGEHYTPREVIRLMVNLLFAEQKEKLQGKGIIRTVFDPACGTGGMLIIAKEHIQQHINADVEMVMFGQELNEQTYAIAKSDVNNGKMVLSSIGKTAPEYWLKIHDHFEYVELDEFVIMSNHVHGIIIINDYRRGDDPRRDTACRVPTCHSTMS